MAGDKRPPLKELQRLFQATIAASGVTTAPGNVGGTSFVDAGLAGAGAGSFFSMMAVVYPGDRLRVASFDITGFDNVTGEVIFLEAYKGGQIPAGVPYIIVTFRFVPAEVAQVLARIGDPTAHTLASLTAKIGDIPIPLSALHGLFYYGRVTAVPGANQFTIPTLAGFGDTAFCDWIAYVFWDTAGVDAAPQREHQAIATYASTAGTFSTGPFTAAVDVGDIILILHPWLVNLLAKTITSSAAGVTKNWQAAEQDLVSIGANNVNNKVHSLSVGIQNLVGTVTIRLYMQVNGVERRIYPIPAATTFSVAADGPAIPVIDGTIGIHEVLRVTVQSNNAADNGQSVDYDYMLEAM